MIMDPVDWLRKYEDAELKACHALFYGSDYIEELKQVVIKMPEGMKRKSIFYKLPYLRDILISHLLDPMHIFKNVPNSVFRHIEGRKKDNLSSRRDIALSHTKFDKKHLWPNRENEKNVESPWILKKKELDQLKNCHTFNKDAY